MSMVASRTQILINYLVDNLDKVNSYSVKQQEEKKKNLR